MSFKNRGEFLHRREKVPTMDWKTCSSGRGQKVDYEEVVVNAGQNKPITFLSTFARNIEIDVSPSQV